MDKILKKTEYMSRRIIQLVSPKVILNGSVAWAVNRGGL